MRVSSLNLFNCIDILARRVWVQSHPEPGVSGRQFPPASCVEVSGYLCSMGCPMLLVVKLSGNEKIARRRNGHKDRVQWFLRQEVFVNIVECRYVQGETAGRL